MKMKKGFLILSLLSIIGSSNIDAATVTSLLDDGSAGTLRSVLASAAGGGETIDFNVTGTIFLDEFLGELVVNKLLTIDGGNKITVDGQDQINICFHVTGVNASGSIIQNIAIQNFNGANVHPGSGTEPQELNAYGIFIENGAEDCSVFNTTIKNITANSEQAAGIRATEIMVGVSGNTVENVSSVFSSSCIGIDIETLIGDCKDNTVKNVFSVFSSSCIGIDIGTLNGDCIGNTVKTVFAIRSFSVGIDIETLNGDCIGNTVESVESSTSSAGIDIGTLTGDCKNNTVESVESTTSSVGIDIGTLTGDCRGNMVETVSTTSFLDSSSVGIAIETLTGDCRGNMVETVSSTSTTSFTSSVGIDIETLTGDCIENTAENIFSSSPISFKNSFSIGISIDLIVSGSKGNGLVECNTVLHVSGNGSDVEGITILFGDNLTIQGNVIDFIENTDGVVHGLLLGDNKAFVTNSLVSFNTVSNIIGGNSDGFGISIENSSSTGNDLLNNSIFNINGKAINISNNGVPVDARVILTSVRCADGCKLIVEGRVRPLIDAPQFKLQFFVSDSNTPEQAQIFIAERVIDKPQDFSFKLKLTGLPPVTFGQFITATATALPAGTEENNNTSEVSNALPACKPTGNFCPCAEVVLPELPVCPVVACSHGEQDYSGIL